MDISNFIGKKEEEVTKELKNDGKMVYHIARRDDESFARTMDYRQDRVNLEIQAGMVVSAIIG